MPMEVLKIVAVSREDEIQTTVKEKRKYVKSFVHMPVWKKRQCFFTYGYNEPPSVVCGTAASLRVIFL